NVVVLNTLSVITFTNCLFLGHRFEFNPMLAYGYTVSTKHRTQLLPMLCLFKNHHLNVCVRATVVKGACTSAPTRVRNQKKKRLCVYKLAP
uniref:Uncharacterized protein n=1 Tax=Hippocampus comes TaxID=109280 RepID=A0A3Q2YLL9_HIPCM